VLNPLLYLTYAPVLLVLSCVAACVCVCMHCIDLFSCKCVYNKLTYLLTYYKAAI